MDAAQNKVRFYVKKTTTTDGYGDNATNWKVALKAAIALDNRAVSTLNSNDYKGYVDDIQTVQVDTQSAEDMRLSRVSVTFTCKKQAKFVHLLLTRLWDLQQQNPNLGNSWDAFPLFVT
eukprot:991132_1